MTHTPENRPRVRQLRVVVEADDHEAAVTFYRNVLGMDEVAAFAEGGDDRVAILDAGRATLEIASPTHKALIDRVEGVTEESPRIRLAFEVDDSARTTGELEAAGARVVAPPVLTPWRSLNARLEAPADLQITVFQETVSPEQRSGLPGFDTDERR
ncbi:VOC family protein [Nocardioides sp.]|uniref:VOC family protein n=1 Tax=Nocardioides sp. TaxID=35761 RepID=UPI0037837A79